MAKHRTVGSFFRVVLFLSCIAILAYGNYDNHELRKVKSELVALGIAGAVMGLQIYWILAHATQAIKSRYRVPRLPYHYLTMVTTDVLSILAWCAAIALLSYWNQNVVYTPRDGDPQEWFECAEKRGSESQVAVNGYWTSLTIVWCEVTVKDRHRLIGNSSALVQLHALIGVSAGSLVLNGLVLTWVLLVGRGMGIGPWPHPEDRRRNREARSST